MGVPYTPIMSTVAFAATMIARTAGIITGIRRIITGTGTRITAIVIMLNRSPPPP